MRLPETHGVQTWVGLDGGGWHVEYYADDDDGSGYGEEPLRQRWYGPEADCRQRAAEFVPPNGWVRAGDDDRPGFECEYGSITYRR